MVISEATPAIPILTQPTTNPVDEASVPSYLPPVTEPDAGPPVKSEEKAEGERNPMLDLVAGEKGEGALRKLINGKGNGVSTLRLRMKFQDSLNSLQDKMAAMDATKAGKSLVDEMDAGIAAGSETLTLSEAEVGTLTELQNAFEAEVTAQLTSYTSGSSRDSEALVAKVEAAFGEMVNGIETRFAQDELPQETHVASLTATPPESPEPFTDTPQAPTPTLSSEIQGFLDSLQSLFAQSFSKLTDTVNSPQSYLPELPGPTGKGRAYDKFLAHYQAQQAPPPGEVDAVKAETMPRPMEIDIQA